jgi:hypothetical protein
MFPTDRETMAERYGCLKNSRFVVKGVKGKEIRLKFSWILIH